MRKYLTAESLYFYKRISVTDPEDPKYASVEVTYETPRDSLWKLLVYVQVVTLTHFMSLFHFCTLKNVRKRPKNLWFGYRNGTLAWNGWKQQNKFGFLTLKSRQLKYNNSAYFSDIPSLLYNLVTTIWFRKLRLFTNKFQSRFNNLLDVKFEFYLNIYYTLVNTTGS